MQFWPGMIKRPFVVSTLLGFAPSPLARSASWPRVGRASRPPRRASCPPGSFQELVGHASGCHSRRAKTPSAAGGTPALPGAISSHHMPRVLLLACAALLCTLAVLPSARAVDLPVPRLETIFPPGGQVG